MSFEVVILAAAAAALCGFITNFGKRKREEKEEEDAESGNAGQDIYLKKCLKNGGREG